MSWLVLFTHRIPPQFRPCSHMCVPPKWEHILYVFQLPNKRSASIAQAGTHHAIGADSRAGRGPFPQPRPWFFPWSNLDKPNLTGSDTLILRTVTSCIVNTVSLFFSGIQARRAGTPPISLRRLVDGSMRLFFKKPVIIPPHITDQFIAYTGNTDLAILLNEDTFEPDRTVLALK